MENLLNFLIFTLCLSAVLVLGHPADHREDTVLPFSLSPGNVNLETYYLDKYPKPTSSGRPSKQKETPSREGNEVLEDEQPNSHAFFRSRRLADPEHIHGGHGHHNQGPFERFHTSPSYGYHTRHHDSHHIAQPAHYNNHNRQHHH